MIATYDSTKKAVISAEGRGAARAGSQGVLRAFAFSTTGDRRLGAALWALKYGPTQPAQAVKAATLLLALQVGGALGVSRVGSICTAALAEWLHDQCPKCTGRGRTGAGREVMERKRFSCPTCHGNGRIFRLSSRWLAYAESGALVGDEIPPQTSVERPCEPCFGKGWREVSEKKNSRLRGCITCHGTGKRRWKDKDRARALKMTSHDFAAEKELYAKALRVLRAVDAEVALHVDFRLSRGENPEIIEGVALHSAVPEE